MVELKGIIIVSLGIPNLSNRIYTEKIVKKTILENPIVKEQLSNGGIFGTLSKYKYDDSGELDTRFISHSTTNIYIEDGKLKADITLLDTPCGKEAQESVLFPYLVGTGVTVPVESVFGPQEVTSYDFLRIDLQTF